MKLLASDWLADTRNQHDSYLPQGSSIFVVVCANEKSLGGTAANTKILLVKIIILLVKILTGVTNTRIELQNAQFELTTAIWVQRFYPV